MKLPLICLLLLLLSFTASAQQKSSATINVSAQVMRNLKVDRTPPSELPNEPKEPKEPKTPPPPPRPSPRAIKQMEQERELIEGFTVIGDPNAIIKITLGFPEGTTSEQRGAYSFSTFHRNEVKEVKVRQDGTAVVGLDGEGIMYLLLQEESTAAFRKTKTRQGVILTFEYML